MIKHLLILFCVASFLVNGQDSQGSIMYSGRVTHMYKEGTQIEIPYERQNTNGVLAALYFDSSNVELDMVLSVAYMLNITLQKNEGWLLYIERYGSATTAETFLYDNFEMFQYDNLEIDYDSSRIIAGYSCNRAQYEIEDVFYEAWFTNEIKVGGNVLPIPIAIPGACLEFSIRIEIADIKYTATEVKKKAPNPEIFKMEIPVGFELSEDPLFPVEKIKAQELENSIYDSEIPPPPPPSIDER